MDRSFWILQRELLSLLGLDAHVLHRYVDDSNRLNQQLRTGKKSSALSPSSQKYKNKLDAVFHAIRKHKTADASLRYTKPFVVYRGIKDIHVCRDMLSAKYDYLYNAQFMSTSFDPSVASSFGRLPGSPGCILRIHVYPEEDLDYIYVSPANKSRDEKEILFDRNVYLLPLLSGGQPKSTKYIDVKASYHAPHKALSLSSPAPEQHHPQNTESSLASVGRLSPSHIRQHIEEEKDFVENDDELVESVTETLMKYPTRAAYPHPQRLLAYIKKQVEAQLYR